MNAILVALLILMAAACWVAERIASDKIHRRALLRLQGFFIGSAVVLFCFA